MEQFIEDISEELEGEIQDCSIEINGDSVEVFLDTPSEKYYNEAINMAEDVVTSHIKDSDIGVDFEIDGDYEGQFTLTFFE